MKINPGSGLICNPTHAGSFSGLVSFDSYTKRFYLVDPVSGSKQEFFYETNLSLSPEVCELLEIVKALKDNPNTKQALEELVLIAKLGT